MYEENNFVEIIRTPFSRRINFMLILYCRTIFIRDLTNSGTS